jgi:ribonuclease HII
MREFEQKYPGYGFAQHKGYPTPQHLAAINSLGACPIHRRSFAPFRPVERNLELFDLAEDAPAEAKAPNFNIQHPDKAQIPNAV